MLKPSAKPINQEPLLLRLVASVTMDLSGRDELASEDPLPAICELKNGIMSGGQTRATDVIRETMDDQ